MSLRLPAPIGAALLVLTAASDARVRAPQGESEPPAMNADAATELGSGEETPVRLTPSAVYVLTAEDIRRSGAATLPDLLRMVPGMFVAQLSTSDWAVSARGFGAQFASKMAVRVDGRDVYSTLFGGVHWDALDVVLEDVERIEVLRGPGGTLWGANAMNGVVNIVTKSSADTQGILVKGGVGTAERLLGVARYGGELARGTTWRSYFKGRYRDLMNPVGAAGVSPDDDQRDVRVGLRFDRSSEIESLTVQGDAYYGVARTPHQEPGPAVDMFTHRREEARLSGASAVARWSEELDHDSTLALKFWYDGSVRDSELYEEGRDVFDFEVSHRFAWLDGHEVLWGGSYRLTSSLIDNSSQITFRPRDRTDNLISAFVMDEIALVPGQLDATIGTRLEHNDYTAFEIQPTAGLLWRPNARETVWASVSRAVRTPTYASAHGEIETSFETIGGNPTHVVLSASQDVVAEELWAYEVGWRGRIRPDFSVDANVFFHDYENLETRELGAFGAQPANPLEFQQNLTPSNQAEATSWGVELASQWNASDDWTLHGGYAWLDLDYDLDPGSTDASTSTRPDQRFANHIAHLRSFWNATETVDVDTGLYWVDALDNGISSYLRADARVGWRPRSDLELSLGVRGLFHDGEREFDQDFFGNISETRSEVYVTLTWTPSSGEPDAVPAPEPDPPPADLVRASAPTDGPGI